LFLAVFVRVDVVWLILARFVVGQMVDLSVDHGGDSEHDFVNPLAVAGGASPAPERAGSPLQSGDSLADVGVVADKTVQVKKKRRFGRKKRSDVPPVPSSSGGTSPSNTFDIESGGADGAGAGSPGTPSAQRTSLVATAPSFEEET
jgi:hypothetical protein